MKKTILLKLGGSLITDKTKPYTARYKVIKDLSWQIKKALIKNKNIQLIIGNGAGSYGHYVAEQYQMTKGINNEDQKIGFCLVQDAVARLNRIIVKSFIDIGLKAVSLHPSSMIVARKNKVVKFFLEPLISFLSLGIIPVIYGDIVYDEINGSSIFSTERLFQEVFLRLSKKGIVINKVISAGITKGILDEKGKTIPVVNSNKINLIKKVFYPTKGFDVTGGMLHKLENSVKLAKKGVSTLIIDGVFNNSLYKALIGEKVKGTIIY